MMRPLRRSTLAAFVQGEGHAPDHAAIELAPHEPRVDDPPGREGADEAGRANLAEIGVDLDLREHRAVRLQRMVADGRRIARALAPSVDLRQAGAGEDVGIALAAALVVLAVEPSGARDDPDIACAEERRVAVGRWRARRAARRRSCRPRRWPSRRSPYGRSRRRPRRRAGRSRRSAT